MDSSIPQDVDVLIVGGRVAGASLALLLGQRGHRVLLVDRDRFPSDTMSTHYMSWMHVALLNQLGVLADVEAAGFRRITRARTCIEDCILDAPISSNGDYALAPRRNHLDAVLVNAATAHDGVEFRDHTRVHSLLHEGERVIGARITVDGKPINVRACVVVGADGKHSAVARAVQPETIDSTPALRPAYYGYYEGVIPLPDPAIELYFTGDQIGFVFPMQPGLDCLALEMQPVDFDAVRHAPRDEFERRFRALPTMHERFANARLVGKIIGTRGIENYIRKPYGPGWALTGDAGLLMDPSTGLGMGNALGQSFWLAGALDAALNGADWDEAMAEFQRQRDEALVPLYKFTLWYTAEHSPSATSLAALRGMLASPATSRMLATALADGLEALPPPIQSILERNKAAFSSMIQKDAVVA